MASESAYNKPEIQEMYKVQFNNFYAGFKQTRLKWKLFNKSKFHSTSFSILFKILNCELVIGKRNLTNYLIIWWNWIILKSWSIWYIFIALRLTSKYRGEKMHMFQLIFYACFSIYFSLLHRTFSGQWNCDWQIEAAGIFHRARPTWGHHSKVAGQEHHLHGGLLVFLLIHHFRVKTVC